MNVNGMGDRKTANTGRSNVKTDKQRFSAELSKAFDTVNENEAKSEKAAKTAKTAKAAERDTLDIGSKAEDDIPETADWTGTASSDRAAINEKMSNFEYEAYIYRTIDRMYNYDDNRENNWIVFSKDALAAMKADPEYEKWVLQKIYSTIKTTPSFEGRNVKVQRDMIIKGSREECIFEVHASGDGIDDGFSGPTNEEYRRIIEARKKEYEKYGKYIKLLRENAVEKADMESEHIRGIYEDFLHIRKNISAVLGDMDEFWNVNGE